MYESYKNSITHSYSTKYAILPSIIHYTLKNIPSKTIKKDFTWLT